MNQIASIVKRIEAGVDMIEASEIIAYTLKKNSGLMTTVFMKAKHPFNAGEEIRIDVSADVAFKVLNVLTEETLLDLDYQTKILTDSCAELKAKVDGIK